MGTAHSMHSFNWQKNVWNLLIKDGHAEGEVAVFSAKCWDYRNRAVLIESATPCHDAKVIGSYRGLSPLHVTVLTSNRRITPLCHNTVMLRHYFWISLRHLIALIMTRGEKIF